MAENLTEPLPIETEAWELALKPYASDASAAYDLARRLMEIKQYLKDTPPNVSLAVLALDDAADHLFPFTEFHRATRDLYRVAIEGHATGAQENLMESLGIKY